MIEEKWAPMQNRTLFRSASIAAVLLLSACGKPETIVADNAPDDMQAQLNAAKPVELPPAMTASKSYRCKDNSLVFVDFFAGDKQAIIHPGKKDATPVTLKADEAGKPLTADGYTLKGSGATVQIAQPGKPEQSCKA